jgi:hypothetical protein
MAKDTVERFGRWLQSNGHPATDWMKSREKHGDIYDRIEKDVLEATKKLHNTTPKYVYDKREPIEEFLTSHGVELVAMSGQHVSAADRLVILKDGTEYTPEEFVGHHFETLGYQYLFVESAPIHVLFGNLMWLLIQDPRDPEQRVIGFGDRLAFDARRAGKIVHTCLPSDFGTSGYGRRRRRAIEAHLRRLPKDTSELVWTFDYGLDHSAELRQYLWAHHDEHINAARVLLEKLPSPVLFSILRYLADSYWARMNGWPDLFVYKESDYFFVEVKSSSDALSDDQRNWIVGNSSELKIPFKVAKIHNISPSKTSSKRTPQ